VTSIRPLALITVLALAGVFLSMKINESEPVLPDGLESWSVNEDIQISDGMNTSAEIGATGSVTSTAPVGGSAPPFSAGPVAPVPAFDPSADSKTNSTAPPWTAETDTTVAPQAALSEGIDKTAEQVSADVAPPPNLPNFPPVPAIPVPDHPVSNSAAAEVYQETVAVPGDASEGARPSTIAPAPSQLATPAVVAPSAPPAEVSTQSPTAQSSLFAATQRAVQAAIDRGELSQALLLLSDWYGDPSLSQKEAQDVQTLLAQLAGTVIYSTEPRLEDPYLVKAGETLEDIAKAHKVPWQLLAKINSVADPDRLQAGQELKVLRGPFSAVVDIRQRRMTLMLDRRYAGQFRIEFDSSISVEEGHWVVNQKLLTPTGLGPGERAPTTPTEDRSLTLSKSNGETSQLAILRDTGRNSPPSEPVSRVIRLDPTDVADVYDILSLGSKVIIRR